ncbi:hypothetical protein OsI_28787 [Oryza sativa Indica Group]|uniref:Uncharacterized protein n=1 Tax=Oryza sativa subsp. indica TaxID=39946 RepID=B8B9R6_ORYSI|nr:hypothetical protein OsI_28787 [Oryza sativa Indica Group]
MARGCDSPASPATPTIVVRRHCRSSSTQWTLTLMMPPCSPIGVFAGFAEVMEEGLLDAHECRKKQPDWSKACYRLGASLMSLKDYGSACDALFDGLKLDPADVQIENALREAFQNLKLSRSTKAK